MFDHRQDRLIKQVEFGTDIDRAMSEYAQAEQDHRDSAAIDIVLVGSDSIETVQKTHSTYFTNSGRELIERALRMSLPQH